MSNCLPPLGTSWSHPRTQNDTVTFSLPSLSTWTGPPRPPSLLLSSPPRSSSPPRTPQSGRGISRPYIQSSPTYDKGALYPHEFDGIDDPSPFWAPFPLQFASKQPKLPQTTLPSLKTMFPGSVSQNSMPKSSARGSSLFTGSSKPFMVPTDASDATFSDGEEEDDEKYGDDDDDDDEGYSFLEQDLRTTFFRTSAERGRWRYDPIPFKTKAHSHLRQSVPTSSSSSSSSCLSPALNINTRPASEPAPSAPCLTLTPVSAHSADAETAAFELPGPSLGKALEKADRDHQSPARCSASLPSLTSDRESSEPDHGPLSPLPPSSPPLSIHSLPTSPIIQASSPLSMLPSSSPPQASSLTIRDDHVETDDERGSLSLNFEMEESLLSPSPPKDEFPEGPECSLLLADIRDLTDRSLFVEEILSCGIIEDPPALPIPVQTIEDAVSRSDVTWEPDNAESNSVVPESAGSEERIKGTKRKRKEVEGGGGGVPVKKRRRRQGKLLDPTAVCESSSSLSRMSGSVKKAPEETCKEDNHGDSPQPSSTSHGKSRGKYRRPCLKPLSDSISKLNVQAQVLPPVGVLKEEKKEEEEEEAVDGQTQALHREIQGMLIECMATSRASSLPVSSLYRSVMECRPALKAERSEGEWMGVFERALRSGEAGYGSGVFGKVESSFKDESNRALEAQWFYVPENDEDQERAALLKSMMPRPGKRSETKKYKQYYYRPLDKISRWDGEDDL